jgi:hypothetical protein
MPLPIAQSLNVTNQIYAGNVQAKPQNQADQIVATTLNNINLVLAGVSGAPRRIPMELTSSARDDRKTPSLKMAVNPQTVNFQQGKRIVKKDTQAGSTFLHFTNEFGQNNDIMKITFAGVTGNIDSRTRTIISGNLVGGPKKLQKWSELYQLTREPVYDMEFNREVIFRIHYHSPLFITGWTFLGFFDQVLTFSESAEKPFLKDWNFSFTVLDTFPSLDDIQTQISTMLQGLDLIGLAGESVRGILGVV